MIRKCPYKTLKVSTGIIFYKDLLNCSLDETSDELKDEGGN